MINIKAIVAVAAAFIINVSISVMKAVAAAYDCIEMIMKLNMKIESLHRNSENLVMTKKRGNIVYMVVSA